MPEQIDVYYSFRSPYSYLATPDMVALERDYDVAVHLRPVLPIAVRASDFFSPANAQRARYIIRDWPRRAEFLGMPHVWPDPDPIVQDMATFKIAEDQPLIYRLTKLGVEAERQGKGPAWAFHVSGLIFSGVTGWDDPAILGAAAAKAGLDLAAMDAAIEDGDHMQEIERNQDALAAAGHWGVPTFVLRDEPFFGQDRVELLRWRMDKLGIARRG